MALVKGKFVDKDIPIQSNNDPVDPKDLARKSYVDQKASGDAASAEAAAKAYTDTQIGDLEGQPDVVSLVGFVAGNTIAAIEAQKGTPGGFASLDESGLVPSSQLPGFVDDVEEYANLEAFPEQGSAGKLYVAQDTNKVYRWSGTVYIEIAGSPGSTDAVPEGSLNLYFTDERAQTAVVPMFNSLAAAVANKVDKQGDEMSGDLSMGTFLVKNLGEPIEENDAARKKYVDDAIAGIDLSGKADLVHTHVAADITDFDSAAEAALADELSGKQDSLGTGTTSQFLRGDLTWQEVATSVGIAQTKVVSKGGSDVTGDGSLSKPYATIAAAMASIADASPTKRYAIKVEAGAYTEGALTLKPNVFVIGDLKEAVRVTATSVAMDATFNQASSIDSRSGMARIILNGACTFDWLAVNSAAGKLYFTEVSFGSAVTMNGGTNAIAQAQFDSCQFFGTLTVSGINVGSFKDNICFGNVNLNQHPNGGMATILNAFGGHIGGTLTLTTTVDNFGRRCSAFLRGMYIENLVVDGVSSYADADLISQGKSVPQLLNGGQLIAMTPRVNHDLETKMLKPLANNSHNNGDWGKQWMFNFAYVHASAGTDMYILSAMENYDPAGDTAGKTIFIQPDAYGLQANANGGNIELETAAVSGTGIRGKVKINARELDMSSKQIKSLADATDAQDAVTKAQLDAAIGGLPGGLSGKKETFTLSAGDIANAYVDCAHLAAADTMMVMSGGVVHVEGESYTLSTVGGVTRITFIGDLVDPSPSKLEAGDKVHVQYLK
jgi:hypothetical protein